MKRIMGNIVNKSRFEKLASLSRAARLVYLIKYADLDELYEYEEDEPKKKAKNTLKPEEAARLMAIKERGILPSIVLPALKGIGAGTAITAGLTVPTFAALGVAGKDNEYAKAAVPEGERSTLGYLGAAGRGATKGGLVTLGLGPLLGGGIEGYLAYKRYKKERAEAEDILRQNGLI